MSWQATSWASLQTAGSPINKLLLLAIANCVTPGGEHECIKSHRALAAVTECAERTVRRALADLESRGLIRREQRKRADGLKTTDHIILNGFAEWWAEQRPTALGQIGRTEAESPDSQSKVTGHTVRRLPDTESAQDDGKTLRSKRQDYPPPPTGDGARATRLPEDWKPSEADRQFAISRGFREAEVDELVDGFRDYWRSIAGARSRRTDWSMTFRNRVRDQAGRRRNTRPFGNAALLPAGFKPLI